MDWVKRMNEAIGYIEAHITEEIDYAEASDRILLRLSFSTHVSVHYGCVAVRIHTETPADTGRLRAAKQRYQSN